MLIVVLQINGLHFNFVEHNVRELFDSLSNVKYGGVFGEVLLLLVEDCVVQNVMHKEVNELGGRKHFLTRALNSFVDGFQFVNELLRYHLVPLYFL